MAYSSWSVSFGEQPSASKWNILGTNDASFNDGTGIATSAITTAKMKPSTISSAFATQGGNFSTASTSYVDVTGMSFTYTPGSTNEKLYLWWRCYGNTTAGNMGVTLSIAGADSTHAALMGSTSNTTIVGFQTYNIAGGAGATTIKMRAKTSSGTATIITNVAEWIPEVIGFAVSNV